MKKILIVMSAAAGLAFVGCRPQNPDAPAVREFIRDNWHTTVQHCTADTATLIGLPYPYTVPTAGAMFREMYYWDTFFTNEGLVRDGHPELAKGNTDNLLYMVRRFGKVYNGSRTYYEARSQTPYHSMMVDRIYRLTGDKQWLADAYQTLKEEYGFWMRERLTPTGLNRYGSSASDALVDEFLVTGGKRLGTDLFDKGYTPERLHKLGLDFVAEAESGWDFNPRYDRRCTDFCPLDLNANLFMYEVNFARFAQELGRTDEIREWIAKAELRRARILQYCYDPEAKQFYDYDYVNGRRSDVLSGAVFALLYSGAVPREYAGDIVQALIPLRHRRLRGQALRLPLPVVLSQHVAPGLLLCGDGTGPLRIRQRGRTHCRQMDESGHRIVQDDGQPLGKVQRGNGNDRCQQRIRDARDAGLDRRHLHLSGRLSGRGDAARPAALGIHELLTTNKITTL